MEDNRKGGIFFIINPVSGRGSARKSLALIRKFCEKKKIRYAFHETQEAGDGSALARKGMACGFSIIVAVGGDGTVNEIGKELVGSDVSLGIIPVGSGNGLARHLGVPLGIRPALRRILKGKKVSIDTGVMDGRTFLNVAGVGFDAQVTKAFSTSIRRGWFNYLKIILRQSTNIPTQKITLEYEKGRLELDALMISIANSSQYGNNAKISPKSKINDGMVEICVLKPVGLIRLLFFFMKVMLGLVRKTSYFEIFQSKSFTLDGTDGMAHVDGDPIEIKSKILIEIKENSLNVIC